MELLISLISGAVGGNVAAGVLGKINLGVLLNSVIGVLGGGLGAKALAVLQGAVAQAGETDFAVIVSQAAAGGVGGAALLVILGLIRNTLAK